MHECSFNISSYGKILEAALKNNYSFVPYQEIDNDINPLSCLLRHDIDSELLSCDPMMDVERDLGVKATYFLMVRSTAYNLFCVEGKKMVEKILQDGHSIGLHFMGELCENDSSAEITEKVLREVRLLEEEFGETVAAVSFHQPNQAILKGELLIPNLINTYNFMQMDQYFYISDTNMNWRHEHPLDVFTNTIYQRLQLLIHPMWWITKSVDTRGKWLEILKANQNAVVAHWYERERSLSGIKLL